MQYINIHTHQAISGEGIQILNVFVPNIPNVTMLQQGIILSVGLHPWFLDENPGRHIETIKEAALNPAVVAFGETGLDKLKGPGIALQTDAFEAHIQLSETYKKPLIIHCVKAYNEVMELHKAYRPAVAWIIHGFSGNRQLAEQLLSRSIYLSFGKSMMKDHKKTIDSLIATPTDLLFFETDDDPDLKIADVYQKASETKNLDIDQLTRAVHHNFLKCFNTDREERLLN
jgi:TatD DNase family protein